MSEKLGMKRRWESIGGWWTCTASRDSVREPRCMVCSEIRRPASYDLSVGGKNAVRCMRWRLAGNLRPKTALGARPVVRRCSDLLGAGDPPRAVPRLRQGEAGEAPLVGAQSLLYEAVRLLRRATVPKGNDPGRCSRTSSRLEDSQGSREAVHAGATAPSRQSRSQGDRHRRSLDPQGSHLPHRGERPGATPTYLVRGRGPIGKESRLLLRMARGREK